MAEMADALTTIAEPTRSALRWDKARRGFESPWTAAGAFALAAVSLPLLPVSGLLPVGVIGGYLGSVFVLRRRVRSFLNAIRPAYSSAELGSFEEALTTCRNMAQAPWPISHLSALTLAYFLRRQGEFDRAIEINGLAAKSDDGFLRAAIGTELAVCFALAGRTGPAMTWLPPLKRKTALQAASYALVWARTGKLDQIRKLRLRKARSMEVFLRHESRLLAVLKAFALFEQQPDYLSIRPLLLTAGPAYSGEFDYLGKSWPQMKEFVDTYVAPPTE